MFRIRIGLRWNFEGHWFVTWSFKQSFIKKSPTNLESFVYARFTNLVSTLDQLLLRTILTLILKTRKKKNPNWTVMISYCFILFYLSIFVIVHCILIVMYGETVIFLMGNVHRLFFIYFLDIYACSFPPSLRASYSVFCENLRNPLPWDIKTEKKWGKKN